MRSKEFVKEAGRNGSFDDSGMPINNTPALPPQQLRDRYGNKIASGTPGVYWNEPADVTLPQTQRNLRDPNSLNQPAQNAQPEITIPQNQRNLRDPNSLNQQEPAYVDRIPAVKPGEPAPVQNADPVPSFNVPGAAQAGQGGTNYTTGVAQDRPHANNAGADEITRNDLPFVPYTGPEPKPDVKPKPNPTPIPRRKVPKSVVQVSPDKQNLATTKTTLTPDEIKAAQEALRDPTIGPRDKAYYTELLKNQPAHPTNMSYDKNGKALFPMANPLANQNAQPVPAAAGSVVIKPGDTLSRIAQNNGTTVQAIMALNPSITNADRISAGQTVKLRESSEVDRIRHLAGLTRN